MGLLDGTMDDGYDPGDPNQVGQPYKVPAANMLDQLGIMSPTQKNQLAYQNQQAMISRQLQQQQMILQMQQERANMGVQSAGLASGFAYPTLLAQQANNGGVQNAGLTRSLNQMLSPDGIIGSQTKPATNQSSYGTGMNGMAPPPAGAVSQSALLAKNMAAAKTPGQGLAQTAQDAALIGQQTGDENWLQFSIKLKQMASDQQAKEALAQANVGEKNASTAKAQQETALSKATAGNPGPVHDINMPGGDTATTRDLRNPDGSFAGTQVGNVGQRAQYTSAEMPGDVSKEVSEFKGGVSSAIQLHNSVTSVISNLQTGATQGWTAEAAGKVNDVLGTFRQVLPSVVTPDLQDALKGQQGTFGKIAAKTGINESYLSDMTMQLAKTYATGGRLSVQDINRAAKVLDEESSDPGEFASVLKSVDGRVGQNLATQRDTLKIGINAKSQQAIDDAYSYYQQRVGSAGHPPDIQALLDKYK